jgi:nucleotide-binding universal stress UspA family protein
MKILLAIDGSKFSDAATQAVIAQAHPAETEVHVLNVVEPPNLFIGREMGGYDPALEVAWETEKERGKSLVEKTAETLRSRGMKASATIELGNPKSVIIDVSEKWHADLIVVGSHGHSAFDRFLMGGVSEAIVRHAHCSVEVVRIPSDAR